MQWQGYAEADFVKVGPTQQGLLMTLAVRRGTKVTPGVPLFEQDDTADLAAREQAAHLAGLSHKVAALEPVICVKG